MESAEALKLTIKDMEERYFYLIEASKKQNGEPSYSGPACANRSMANTISNWITLLRKVESK